MAEQKPVKLAYVSVTPEGGAASELPPLILLHGLTSCKERWRDLMQTLADKTKRKVIAVDARNHGESERSDFFNFTILAKDLELFMDTMEIPKATIIGHSMGGIVGITMALTMPERVEKLVIEDISPKRLKPEMYYFFSKMLHDQTKCLEQFSLADNEATVHQELRECIYRTVPMIPDEDREVLQKTEFPIKKTDNGYESLTNLKVIAKALEDPEGMQRTHTGVFSGDALFIYGEKSTIEVSEDKDIILEHFPKVQFHPVSGAGHEVYGRCPDEYLAEVLKFL